MGLPEGVLELEMRSVGQRSERTLPEAYELLKSAWWGDGPRSRELALHLAFVAWYLFAEPLWLTGLDETRAPDEERRRAFQEAHDYLGVGESTDPELLYVFGIMAAHEPWALGDEPTWKACAETYMARHRVAAPHGTDPTIFLDRGAYGAYFHHYATRSRQP